MDAREKAARLDLIAFQLGEIEKAAPRPGEDEELAATKQVLASAERIQRLCEESYAALYDSDDAVLAGLGGVWKRVGELATIDPQFAPYADARDAIKSQLEDLAFFLRALRRRHRRVARPAAAGRGSARAARAAEAEVRADAART